MSKLNKMCGTKHIDQLHDLHKHKHACKLDIYANCEARNILWYTICHFDPYHGVMIKILFHKETTIQLLQKGKDVSKLFVSKYIPCLKSMPLKYSWLPLSYPC